MGYYSDYHEDENYHPAARFGLQVGVVFAFTIVLSLTIGLGELLFDVDGENWPDAITDGLPAPLSVPLHILQVALMGACYLLSLATLVFGTIGVWIYDGLVSYYYDGRAKKRRKAAEAEEAAQREAERIVKEYGKPDKPALTADNIENQSIYGPGFRCIDMDAFRPEVFGLTEKEGQLVKRLEYLPEPLFNTGQMRLRSGLPLSYWGP